MTKEAPKIDRMAGREAVAEYVRDDDEPARRIEDAVWPDQPLEVRMLRRKTRRVHDDVVATTESVPKDFQLRRASRYQRNYSWTTTDECKQLWSDLMRLTLAATALPANHQAPS